MICGPYGAENAPVTSSIVHNEANAKPMGSHDQLWIISTIHIFAMQTHKERIVCASSWYNSLGNNATIICVATRRRHRIWNKSFSPGPRCLSSPNRDCVWLSDMWFSEV